MIKIFDSNMKRLNGIIVTYEDKKGKEVDPIDIKDRNSVIRELKDTMRMFKDDYEYQTKSFKSGTADKKQYNFSLQNKERNSDDEESKIDVDRTGDEFVRQNDFEEDDDADLEGKPNFERNLIKIERKLQKLEKKYLLQDQDLDMAVQWRLGEHSTHSYFLDTVQSFRPHWLCYFDMILIVLIYAFLMSCGTNLHEKGWIDNIHGKYR